MVGVNLIPLSEQYKQLRRARFARWGGVLALGLLALCISAGMDWTRRAEATQLRDSCDRIQTQLAEARSALRSVTSDLQAVEHEIEHATALRTKRSWSGMIALLARCLPEGCWLRSLATEPDKPIQSLRKRTAPPASGAESAKDTVVMIEAPRRLRIVGFAPVASDPNVFVQALQESAVFARVDLERSQEESILSALYYRFEVTCEW